MYKLGIRVVGSENFELKSESVVQVYLTKKERESKKIKSYIDRRTGKLQWKDGLYL